MIQLSTLLLPGAVPSVRAAGFPLGTTSDFALALADLAGAPELIAAPAAPPGEAVAALIPRFDTRQAVAGGGKDLPAVEDAVLPVADDIVAVAMPVPGVTPGPAVIPVDMPDSIAPARTLMPATTVAPTPLKLVRAPRIAVPTPRAVVADSPIVPPVTPPPAGSVDLPLSQAPLPIAGAPVPMPDAGPIPDTAPAFPLPAVPRPERPAIDAAVPVGHPTAVRRAAAPIVAVAPPSAASLPTAADDVAPVPEAADALTKESADPVAPPAIPDVVSMAEALPPPPASVPTVDAVPSAPRARALPAIVRSMPVARGPAPAPMSIDAAVSDVAMPAAAAPEAVPHDVVPAEPVAPPLAAAALLSAVVPAAAPRTNAIALATSAVRLSPAATRAPVHAAATAPTASRAAPPPTVNPPFAKPGPVATPRAVSGIILPAGGKGPAVVSAVATPATTATVRPIAAAAAGRPAPIFDAPPTSGLTADPRVVASVVPAPVAPAPILADPATVAEAPAPAVSDPMIFAPAQPAAASPPPMPATAVPAASPAALETGRVPAPVTVTVVALPAVPPPPPQLQPAAQAFAAAMFAAAEPRDARTDDPADALPFGVVVPGAPAAPSSPGIAVQAAQPGQQPTLDMTRGDWMASMIDRIETLRDDSGALRETRMKLAPEALGNVEVAVRRDEQGAIQVRIAADTPQARLLLADAAPRLAEMAEARGVKIGGSSVDAHAGFTDQGRRDAPAAPAPVQRRPASAADDTDDTTTDSRLA